MSSEESRHRISENAFNTCILCLDSSLRSRMTGKPDSSLYPVLFYNAIPDRILRPFKNDRQIFKRNTPDVILERWTE